MDAPGSAETARREVECGWDINVPVGGKRPGGTALRWEGRTRGPKQIWVSAPQAHQHCGAGTARLGVNANARRQGTGRRAGESLLACRGISGKFMLLD